MKSTVIIMTALIGGCATQPKCGYPAGNRVIYQNQKTCEVRIRQVTIGADLKVPESMKGPGLVAFELDWVEPGLVNGEIIFGHFVLAKKSAGGTK